MLTDVLLYLVLPVGIYCLGFFFGYQIRKNKDKPVYIPESMPHDEKQYPHHLHDHDKVKK